MTKHKYIFLNCGGQIVPQNLDDNEAGPVIISMLDQNAVILPVVCSAENSKLALNIYENKIKGNIGMLGIFFAQGDAMNVE